jgi:hypothetical protein
MRSCRRQAACRLIFLPAGTTITFDWHGEAELERAPADRGTVLRLQADGGAGEAWGDGRRERGNQVRTAALRIMTGVSGDGIAGSVRLNR